MFTQPPFSSDVTFRISKSNVQQFTCYMSCKHKESDIFFCLFTTSCRQATDKTLDGENLEEHLLSWNLAQVLPLFTIHYLFSWSGSDKIIMIWTWNTVPAHLSFPLWAWKQFIIHSIHVDILAFSTFTVFCKKSQFRNTIILYTPISHNKTLRWEVNQSLIILLRSKSFWCYCANCRP